MRVPFSAEETLKIAVRIEENGKKLYDDLASSVNDTELKDEFKDLAQQEVQHKETFQGMLEETETETGPDLNELIYGELEDSYIKALADSKIFTPANKNVDMIGRAETRGELLTLAISLERDTILYYYEILDVAEEQDRDVIKDIIEEEKSHVKRLAGLL